MSAGWTREQMAARTAQDIPDGSYVNLGIGIPELVTKFVPKGREFIYHTENGLLGMGPPPADDDRDLDLIVRRLLGGDGLDPDPRLGGPRQPPMTGGSLEHLVAEAGDDGDEQDACKHHTYSTATPTTIAVEQL